MAALPYIPTPGSIKTVFEKMKAAATPERVTADFVSSKLQLKGGAGRSIPPLLKKIGFVAPDGSPTDLYKRFRNHATSGAAVAEAIRVGYKELASANEYFYELNDKDLQALIVQVTGAAAGSSVVKQTFMTLKILKSYADFEGNVKDEPTQSAALDSEPSRHEHNPSKEQFRQSGGVGLNLSYTINLNLPATSDQAVFNAIFRSLKEHLLSSN